MAGNIDCRQHLTSSIAGAHRTVNQHKPYLNPSPTFPAAVRAPTQHGHDLCRDARHLPTFSGAWPLCLHPPATVAHRGSALQLPLPGQPSSSCTGLALQHRQPRLQHTCLEHIPQELQRPIHPAVHHQEQTLDGAAAPRSTCSTPPGALMHPRLQRIDWSRHMSELQVHPISCAARWQRCSCSLLLCLPSLHRTASSRRQPVGAAAPPPPCSTASGALRQSATWPLLYHSSLSGAARPVAWPSL